ncbi:bacteriophage antitermination protein Q, partial [Escherichia coli]
MNTQYLQYVREQLIVATADLSGATKGQLEAVNRPGFPGECFICELRLP